MQGYRFAVRVACCAVMLAFSVYSQEQDPSEKVNSLQELIEYALSHNPGLLAARERLAETQALLRQAGLRPNPVIDVSVADGDVLASRGEREFEFGYSHIFELGGKRARRVDAARIEGDLASFEISDRERFLRAEVKARYAEALAAMRSLGNTQRVLELTRKSYELAQARIREGEGAPLEQGLLRVEVNRIESDRLLFKSQVDRAILELQLLAGMDRRDAALNLLEPLAAPAFTINADELVQKALAQRPDVQAARLQERLANAELSLARAQGTPDLVVTGRYAHIQSRFDQYGFIQPGGPLVPLRDKDNLLTAGISISLPIRNRNQGNIAAAIARSKGARFRREALERSVRQEVLASANRYQAAQMALGVFDQGAVQQSQENLRIVQGAYELGELRLLDVINEQRRLLETQRAYTSLLRDANVALAELERAVGVPVQ